jgi:contractile injection system tube protein/LysM domain-containing protein
MPLTKAKIIVLDPNDLTTVKDQFEVQFNPEEYSLNKDNNFASQTIPGLSSPILQFVNGNLRTLEIELFFDTVDQQTDVRDQSNRVVDLLKIDSDSHAPPILRFVWGSLDFTCVLARANQKFTRFMSDGRPVRARVTVSFSEFIDAEREAKEVNRQTADFSKFHIVVQDETLSAIANTFYHDPLTWRPIAIANGIDDPRSIVPGQVLRIPSLPFVDQDRGEVFK